MLRECRFKDLTACLDIFYEIFTSEPWNYTWMNKSEMRRYFADLYRMPGFFGYLYYDENVPGGSGSITPPDALTGACMGCISDYFLHTQYDIKEIFIRKTVQNKGAGSRMIREIESDLLSKDVACITLMTQRNIPAFDFYLKNGFTEGETTVYMTKALVK